MDFENLYQQYSPKIFRLCHGYFNDVDMAKDITQETFITVFENLGSLKNTSNIPGWIFRIATNKCLRQIENEKRNQTVTDYNFTKIEASETLHEDEKLVRLRNCIKELSEIDRLIIGLYLEDVAQEKIGEIIGINHSNVRVRIHRIKDVLSKKMKTDEQ
ncbi:RNA polymerase sigma factor [Chryseobacterium vrystaatense]|uniref:RNA polymerase sigma-70 factor, ECF subfamily n=1 Tax=Chryseobacterium vrystaatense TaxID=307480 RepID=A0A1M5EEY2_9FLAO|nr:RNA polymerase sigma factor [Chryseobacterium vrystaatense]KFF25819.1 hypothetical protein IW16_13165 [Chryseobacterium vrystaatense]SHF77853.1 RNA polymerase sigma-70 factor, ECF subfamily [Chryseobacterium vrystaatense]